MYIGISKVYCIKPEGIIHYTKGYIGIGIEIGAKWKGLENFSFLSNSHICFKINSRFQ